MSHVKGTGYVGGRDNNTERLSGIIDVRLEKCLVDPVLIPLIFDGFGIVCLR
jgi:hypothetical protein